MRSVWPAAVRRAAAAAAALLAAASLPAAAEPRPDGAFYRSHFEAVAAIVTAQMVERPTREEGERLALVERLVAERRAVRGIKSVSRRQAAFGGLTQSLSLAVTAANPESARTLIKEAEAVFDPALDLQVGYTRGDTYGRQKVGLVRERFFLITGGPQAGFEDINNAALGEVDPLQARTGIPAVARRLNLCSFAQGAACTAEEPVIRAIEFYQDLAPSVVEEPIAASAQRASNSGHPEQRISFTLALAQQLPWGGSVSITDQTLWNKIFYNRNSAAWQSDGAWTTNLTLQLDTPVPLAKGFGEWNENQAAIRRAEALAERADWALKAAVNQTLRDADLAYFEVTRALESLASTVENRRLIAALQARMNRLFAAEEATRFQKAQLDNEAAKAEIRVEQAFNAYVNASIALANIIGDPDVQRGDVLYLPYGYTRALAERRRFEAERVLAVAAQNRPELFISDLDRKGAEIDFKVAENNTRPDIRIGGSATFAQDASTFGYEHPVHSHNRIVRPDIINQNYAITYTYPWLNRGPRATEGRARAVLDQRELGVKATGLDVRRQVTQALAALQSARSRLQLATDELENRRNAYRSLVNQQEVGIIAEDELINASRQLLTAELSLISARIQAQQAETELLFAQGVIAAELPRETAQSGLERQRLQGLAATGQLAYLNAPPRSGTVAEGGAAR